MSWYQGPVKTWVCGAGHYKYVGRVLPGPSYCMLPACGKPLKLLKAK